MGLFLAAGTLALQWLDNQWLARAHSGDDFASLIAATFLGLGVLVGGLVSLASAALLCNRRLQPARHTIEPRWTQRRFQ
jgi:hypothetical protein